MKKLVKILTLGLIVSFNSYAQTVYITSSGGFATTEKWMSITTGLNGTGTVVWSQGVNYGDNQGLVTDEAVNLSSHCGTTLYLNAYDRYDDDWDGTTYEIRTAPAGGGTLIINNGGLSPDDGNDTDSDFSWETPSDELESSESFSVACPCNFTMNMIQDCNSDLSYSVIVNVTSLGASTNVDITNGGAITFFNNVGIGSYTVTGLSGTSTVEIEDNLACTQSITYNSCDICSLSSSPSDEPCTAPLIDLTQPFYGSTACAYTPTAGSLGGCGSIENDSYIKFIASDDTVEIKYTVQAADADCSDGVQFFLFEENTSCSDLVAIPGTCVNAFSTPNVGTTDSWKLFGLIIGDEYYIRTDGSSGDLCDYNFEPIDGIAITPPNDDCFSSTAINCGERDTSGIVLATDADSPTTCAGVGTTGKGVWYTVVGTGADITVSTDNGQTNFDTQINVYTGDCANIVGMTCVAADDDSGTGLTSTLTFSTVAATTYYIYVDGDGTAQGTFEIDLSCSACPADAGTWD